MKNEMYIILTLIPLLTGCGDKKEAARGAMPVPEISVASPVVGPCKPSPMLREAEFGKDRCCLSSNPLFTRTM